MNASETNGRIRSRCKRKRSREGEEDEKSDITMFEVGEEGGGGEHYGNDVDDGGSTRYRYDDEEDDGASEVYSSANTTGCKLWRDYYKKWGNGGEGGGDGCGRRNRKVMSVKAE